MNPFVTRGYAGPQYFCDREKETNDIVQLLTNGNNLALISPRRLGKTDLIRHCFAQPALRDHYYTFLIDIYATNTLRDFVNVLGKAILEALKSRGRKAWEGFLFGLKSLQAELSFDFTGNPVWALGLSSIENPDVTLDEIFDYLNHADRPCIVAIDEFQQVTSYPDGERVEATLRSHIQRCNNAVFVFSGSRRHLMGNIFSSPARPFYQSVVTMSLAPISCEKYAEFAENLFAQNGKQLQPGVVEKVYQQFDGITLCLQRVMNVLFMNTPDGGIATIDMVEEAVNYLLNLLGDNFESMVAQLPEKQRSVLRAIAAEGVVKSISSGAFTKHHRLLSPSSTVAATKALVEKDFVAQDNGHYLVYDRFLALWLKQNN